MSKIEMKIKKLQGEWPQVWNRDSSKLKEAFSCSVHFKILNNWERVAVLTQV